ncbi:TonB-dependent siderophore receptor [Methylorubrum salsuginis]|uniref:Iron complex outermembrane recepter protein n=1 Tax=Methylorubrum salsuginis TaxID=414703 RepID=A0A1I4HF28_9HYPH|nr:TonB-dependent siderophore receptor [Methylorubrum salsuginis]SFL40006.1 iron complex outermembrane recepter protein [Methylorubrum salsuginis]
MRSVHTRVGRHGLRRAALAGASLLALTAGALAQQSTRLDEIAVEGSGGNATAGRALPGPRGPAAAPLRENPLGPVDGYVATRSVSATKTNTPLLETPQSVTVIGRKQIEAQGAQTLTQATQYTAGIYSGTFGPDQRQDYFTLRGFVASDYGIYKDGLQMLNYGFGTMKIETYGLERIEVIRGPAATLFGAGNPGGMVNQITKRPTTTAFGEVEVGGGSFGQVYGAFDVGGPADESGHLFYRLTGIGRMGGTQVDGADADRAYIAPAFTWRPDAGTSLTVLTSYQRDSSAVTANFLPYLGTVRPNVSGLRIDRSLNVGDPRINTFQREQAYAGYEFEHAIDATWTVRQNLRYSFSDAIQNSYIGQIGYTDADQRPLLGTQTQLGRYQFNFSDKVNLFQVDNQAEARFSDGLFLHDVLFGVDYKNYTLHDNQGSIFPGPSLNLLNPVYGIVTGRPLPYQVNVNRFDQLGLYVQDQIKLTDRLTLVGGLRQDFAQSDVDTKLNPLGSTSRKDQALTGRIALLYNFDPGIAPYVSYSTSFQPQIGLDALTLQSLKPDRGEQVEVGVKVEPLGENYSFTFAAFDLVRDNAPFPVVADIPPFFGSTQLGTVRSRGVEAQFAANLFDGLNVVAAFTHYDLEYIKVNDPRLIQLLGKTPTNVPETLASIFADYTIPTGDLRGFGFGGGVRYVGRSFANQLNSLQVPEYVLFDATVHYNWGNNWRAAITAANIGDRRFVSSCQSANSCFYGEARRVIASVNYRW